MQHVISHTAEEISRIKSDIIPGRDSSYITSNRKGTLRSKKTLSRYITGGINNNTDNLELLRRGRMTAQGLISSMTDGVSPKVRIGGDTSYTDGKVINLATYYIDDASLSADEKVDLMCGFATHESLHIRHTNMKRFTDFINTFSTNAWGSIAETKMMSIVQNIYNILEDERIEMLCGKQEEDGGDGMPGLSGYLANVKEYVWGKYAQKRNTPEREGNDGTNALIRKINELLLLVRYPSALKNEDIDVDYSFLEKARKILSPYPMKQEGVETRTRELIALLMEDIENEKGKDMDESNDSEGNGKESSEGGNETSNAKGDKDNQSLGEALKKIVQNLSEDEERELTEILEEANDTINAGDSKNGKINSDCITVENASTREIKKINEDINTNGNERNTEKSETGEISLPSGDKITVRKPKGGAQEYNESLTRTKRYIPAMKRALTLESETREWNTIGREGSKLSSARLPQLKTGNENLWLKWGEERSERSSICLLIDESGSMSGKRIEAARDAAVLIENAVREIPSFSFHAYGFTSEYGFIKLDVFTDRTARRHTELGSIKALGGTPLAPALEYIRTKTPVGRRNENTILIVLTDGSPDYRTEAQMQLKEMKNCGIHTIGIDMAGSKYITELFGTDGISITDMADLPKRTAQIVKRYWKRTVRRVED